MRKRGMPILCPCAWAVACLTLLSGCNDPYPTWVASEYGPAVKICPIGPTFAWRPGFETTWSDPAVPYYENKVAARNALVEALQNRGFNLASSGHTVDFWIDYRYASRFSDDPFDTYDRFRMSILVLHMIDPVSRLGVWRGWAAIRLPEEAPIECRRAAVCKAVKEIMDKFPYQPLYAEETVLAGAPVEVEPVPAPAPAPVPAPESAPAP
jgi:hypothetical protein